MYGIKLNFWNQVELRGLEGTVGVKEPEVILLAPLCTVAEWFVQDQGGGGVFWDYETLPL